MLKDFFFIILETCFGCFMLALPIQRTLQYFHSLVIYQNIIIMYHFCCAENNFEKIYKASKYYLYQIAGKLRGVMHILIDS